MPIISTAQIQTQLTELRTLADNKALTPAQKEAKLRQFEGDFSNYVVRKFNLKQQPHINSMTARVREYVRYNAMSTPPKERPDNLSTDLYSQSAADRQIKFDSVRKLDLLEWTALAFYTDGGETINGRLRNEATTPLPPVKVFHKEQMDAGLAKLANDPKYTGFAKYYRSATNQALIAGKNAGDTFSDPAYLSVTSNKYTGKKFLMKNQEEIHTQKNATFTVLFSEKAVNIKPESSYPQEDESLLPRNTRLEVVFRDDSVQIPVFELINDEMVERTITQASVVAHDATTPAHIGTNGSAKALTDLAPADSKKPSALIDALLDKTTILPKQS